MCTYKALLAAALYAVTVALWRFNRSRKMFCFEIQFCCRGLLGVYTLYLLPWRWPWCSNESWNVQSDICAEFVCRKSNKKGPLLQALFGLLWGFSLFLKWLCVLGPWRKCWCFRPNDLRSFWPWFPLPRHFFFFKQIYIYFFVFTWTWHHMPALRSRFWDITYIWLIVLWPCSSTTSQKTIQENLSPNAEAEGVNTYC